jgi:hypothetical protein
MPPNNYNNQDILLPNVNNRRHHHHHQRRNNRRRSNNTNNNLQIYTFNNNNTDTTTTAQQQVSSSASSSTTSNTTTSGIRYLFTSSNNNKHSERNLLSASCSIFCIAILAVSLIEIRWFYLNGGGCNVNYLGAAHFFSPSRLEYQLEMSKITKTEYRAYTFYLSNGLELRNCANREIMLIMRTCIAFVFLAIFSSCCGLMLDTFGCMRPPGLRLIRRNAVFHIMTVIFCLIINGFCFWLTEKMQDQQNETRSKKGKKILVQFDVSYYLIVIASGLSILATAFTLIRRYPSDEDEQLERLLEEYTGFEEPIHLERSLPATNTNTITTPNNNNNNNIVPPPPLTPPPSLHCNNINNNNNSLVLNVPLTSVAIINNNNNATTTNIEPPPPYHHQDTSLLTSLA